MQAFQTPKGRAGCDQLDGMTESVQSELEQMFLQSAKSNVLSFGVGRTVGGTERADSKIMKNSQQEEPACQK